MVKKSRDKKNKKISRHNLSESNTEIKPKEKWFFLVVGIIFLILWLIEFTTRFKYYNEYQFLWFCSFSLLFLALGFLFKSSKMLMTFLPLTIIYYSIWASDFIFLLITGKPLIGFTDYMFDNGKSFFEFTNGLIGHLFILPFTLIGLKKLKRPVKNAWIYTIILIIIIAIVSRYMVPVRNLNCVNKPCFATDWSIPSLYYFIGFFIFNVIIACVILSPIINWFLNKSFKDINKDKILRAIIMILFALGMIAVIFGYVKFFNTIHYRCVNNNPDIICERVMDVTDKAFLSYYKTTENPIIPGSKVFVAYHVENKIGKNCLITVLSDGQILNTKNQNLIEVVSKGYISIPVPKKNSDINLEINCDNPGKLTKEIQ